MESNARKSDSGRLRPSSVSCSEEKKQVRKIHARKVPYRVGYSWNKGGRLKELRIRHLARKFLKIWIENTFGQILPHEARSHYNSVLLRKAFEGWRDEWWTSRREWSLTMRAECHYRYYLYNLAFKSWRAFIPLQKEKKSRVQNTQSLANRRRLHIVWDRWEVFTEMRLMKNRMNESAFELNRHAALRFSWRLWQTRLQQHKVLYSLEEQVLKQRALTIQRRTWLQWKETYIAACCQKEREYKASLHFNHRLKRKTIHCWKRYVDLIQTKRKSQALVRRVCHSQLVRSFWTKWSSALYHKRREEERLQTAGYYAGQSPEHRAQQHWKAYVTKSREDYERSRIASQHHHHHLLRLGLQGLSQNTIQNKTHRINNNIAFQHCCQTMMRKYWKLWKDRLEEAEDKSVHALREMALTKCEQRHMQELEHQTDVCFDGRMLPLCFNSWVDFTLRRRLQKQKRHKAEIYNQQRQYSWVFYTWCGQAEKHKEQILSERIAILHEQRCHMQRAWRCWKQRTEQQIHKKEKQRASDHLHLHRLLHKTVMQRKDTSTEIRDRRNRQQQACDQSDLCCMKWAVEKWKQFVQSQRMQKSRLMQMQRYNEVKLLKNTFMAWKKHHLRMCQLYCHAEALHRRQEQNFIRNVLSVWRENAVLLTEARLMEQQAQDHFQHFLQLKVFFAWRGATTHAVSTRCQKGETVTRAERPINQVQLLWSFRGWRKDARDALTEKLCMERARRHHESKLLCKALKAWNEHHNQYHKNKVMKRQGNFLLRLKMYQTYFEQWRVKRQHRRREAEQKERALWHWSLSLQAKVLCGWRLWVAEQRRKQEQVARAAQVYRDQLLREGVTCILTYAAHMNNLTTDLTEHSQEQRSRRLQRVVRSCAMRWKQRALCKPESEREITKRLPKKSVTFCLPAPALMSDSLSESVSPENEDEEIRGLRANHMRQRPSRRREILFGSPHTINTDKQPAVTGAESVLPGLHPAHMPVAFTQLRRSPQETQDLLLPPSAFISSPSEDHTFGKTNSSGYGDGQSPVHPDVCVRECSGDPAAMDPISALLGELLSIQQDMKTYQQDRKQLRALKKLKEVLQSWLQTSGKDDHMEKNVVCQELKKLEERIAGLCAELAKRKPTMLLHVEKIQLLKAALTDLSVFTK